MAAAPAKPVKAAAGWWNAGMRARHGIPLFTVSVLPSHCNQCGTSPPFLAAQAHITYLRISLLLI